VSITTDLRILGPKAVGLSRRSGTLSLTIDGDRTYEDVMLVRVFPLSDPDHYWGLLDSDGKDLGVIVDPAELDGESRATAMEELEKRYFIPVIERVIRVRDDHGSTVWQVETDKGERQFSVRNMKDSLVELGGPRILLVDVDGNRYEIPDTRRLDAKSYDLILRSQ
jgi:hypothetical protein